MPKYMTEQELADRRAKAVWVGAHGNRLRAWWLRLMITTISDAIRGHVWPKTKRSTM
jgi:hypothetical protein